VQIAARANVAAAQEKKKKKKITTLAVFDAPIIALGTRKDEKQHAR
jgi:energy-converting hydrogenase Eha subunit A